MITGKISENILKRSVLKKIGTRRSEVSGGPGIGKDCAVLSFDDKDVFTVSSEYVSYEDIGDISYTVIRVLNNITASGGEPIAVTSAILLDEGSDEYALKAIVSKIEKTCKAFNVEVIGGHTEVTDAVVRPVITVTGIGKARGGANGYKKLSGVQAGDGHGAKAGDDIVITGSIALEGTAVFARLYREKLLSRFPAVLVDDAVSFEKDLYIGKQAAAAMDLAGNDASIKVTAMHDLSSGGIFAALWEMGEKAGLGFTAYLDKIPIKQETIEICNFLDINPYVLMSAGAMLIATDNSKALIKGLAEAGVEAAVLGSFNDSNDRVIINGEIKRFLGHPIPDERTEKLLKQR